MKSQILRFKDMPFEFQRSIVVYGGEDGIVDWTVIPAWEADNKVDWLDKNSVQIWIDDYSKVYADREFRIGTISLEKVKNEIPFQSGNFDSFEEYHKWYRKNDRTDHGDSVFPIIVSNCDKFIEDGWHRFHSYVHKGMKEIPFVKYI